MIEYWNHGLTNKALRFSPAMMIATKIEFVMSMKSNQRAKKRRTISMVFSRGVNGGMFQAAARDGGACVFVLEGKGGGCTSNEVSSVDGVALPLTLATASLNCGICESSCHSLMPSIQPYCSGLSSPDSMRRATCAMSKGPVFSPSMMIQVLMVLQVAQGFCSIAAGGEKGGHKGGEHAQDQAHECNEKLLLQVDVRGQDIRASDFAKGIKSCVAE